MHADAVSAFIDRWQHADGRERANYQLFLTELATLLELPQPEPATADDAGNAYVFERRVGFRHGDGSQSWGYIDLYRRGAFVLEAKDVREASDHRYTQGMLRARSQAENYARALPAEEGRPPFVVVVDVGRSIELYSEFSRSGATYVPFPDPRSHRIGLEQLRDAGTRERLRAVWLEPLSLDPARRSAIVTREIAAHLAELARSLEADGHAPQAAADFLSRCLFTMFAEDVGLIPANAFRDLLHSLREQPAQLVPLLGDLWRAMDAGQFSVAIRADLLRFNGKLFKQPDVLPLRAEQIDQLLEAASADWREVEPAIFGTLLERALDPTERHALGAHYTPRAYVERLVLPTVIEPLREDWKTAQASALTLAAEGDLDAALATIVDFHRALCAVRVLDPACGSANFLYVTLEHMKRLEGEVLNAFDELDPQAQAGRLRQGGLALDGERANPFGSETVDPHQLLGIELNPRAAAIAELVLWIGYLQWQLRTHPEERPAEPVLRDFRNIECRDAVLDWDAIEYQRDDSGQLLTRWDGKTMKSSPITGEPIPDESARIPLERYIEPRKTEWPPADFVVGNPPFIGTSNMRRALGDGYAEALRKSWPEVPESADFVMYWWQHAAALTRAGHLRRFGLITTNSIRQTFNRRVLEAALEPKPSKVQDGAHVALKFEGRWPQYEGAHVPLNFSKPWPGGPADRVSLVFAIPDHPWVDAADGAAVRIAMTVGQAGAQRGQLQQVSAETSGTQGEVEVELRPRRGQIHADLSIGANVGGASALMANGQISQRGLEIGGSGFIVTMEVAARLGLGRVPGIERHLRPYRNGRDLTATPRGVFVIDLFGLDAGEARQHYPSLYQHVLERVKPERDQNRMDSVRVNWWLHRRLREDLRRALNSLPRYIATVETAKHRVFQFLDGEIAPDNMLVVIASDDAHILGVLSSSVHVHWALAAGGRLGVGNDPRYNKTRCFETFPFPAASQAQQARIRDLAEQVDAHRKRQQAAHPGLTLTNLYNVLEKLRAGAALTSKERTVHEQGLVSVLRQLHDELDLAVLDAYGWNDLAPLLATAHGIDPTLLCRSGFTRELLATAHGIDPTLLCRSGFTREPTQAKPEIFAAEAAPTTAGVPMHTSTPCRSGFTREPMQANPETLAAEAAPTNAPISREKALQTFDEAILERLVALNAERAAEEKRGQVRWLRPEFQNPQGQSVTASIDIDRADSAPAAIETKKKPWPKELPDQVRAVAELIAESAEPLDEAAIATCFNARGRWRERLPTILDTLVAIGRIRSDDGSHYTA